MRLLGYSLTFELIRPGDTLPFVLFWQAREKVGRDYLVSLQLQDEDGQAWGEHRSRPVEGAYPTTRWDEGEIVRDQRDWVVPPEGTSGRHRLLIGLIDEASGEQVGQADLGWVTVEARERVTTVPPIGYPLVTNLNHQVELLGYDLEETILRPGDTLHLALYWRALAEMDSDIDILHGHIVKYLSKISSGQMSGEQSSEVMKLLQVANHLEQIGDVLKTNLVKIGQQRIEEDVVVSEPTQQIIERYHQEVARALKTAVKSVSEEDREAALTVKEMKKGMAELAESTARYQVGRLVVNEPNRLQTFTRPAAGTGPQQV